LGYPTVIMKRAAALFSMALFSFGLARAQSSLISQIAGDKAASEKLYFSLKFGVSCGTLRGVEEEWERLGGAHIGLFATIRLSEKFSLVPEVDPVSRKGVTNIPFSTTGDPELDPYFDESTKSALVLNYIDIPVLLKYRLGGRVHLAAGPFVGFLTSAKERFRAELETGEELSFKQDVTTAYRSLDYGLVFEASVVLTKPRRGVGLVFHVRTQAGLADVLDDRAAAVPFRTSVVQIFFSFPFIH
jgi:hypothetical protein